MIVAFLIAVLLPCAVMYGVLLRVWGRDGSVPSRLLAAAIAPPFGLGVASIVYFMLLVANGRWASMRLDAVLWLAAGGWLAFDRTRRPLMRPGAGALAAGRPAGSEWRPAILAAAIGCAVLVGVAVASVWLHMIIMPNGEWDALAIWNLRARAIARGAPDWAALFSPAIGWSHPDYPLLIPATIARFWSYSGRESLLVSQSVAMLFFLSSVATVAISVGWLRGPTAGLLGATAVVAARTYVFQGSCQCGDVPMGFFVLVAVSFGVLAREAQEPMPFLVTAGAAAGLATWTKNEGALLLAVIGFYVLVALPARRFRGLWWLAAGAAVPLAAVAAFKFHLSPANELFALQTRSDILAKIVDATRWNLVLTRLPELIPAWGGGPAGLLPWIGLSIALTARASRASACRAVWGLLLVAAMLGGYAIVYVITPTPQAWLMATTFDRLMVQVWPATVWAVFQLTAGPRLEHSPGS